MDAQHFFSPGRLGDALRTMNFINSHGVNVIVANGDRVSSRGLAEDVAIRIGEEFFTVDCYTIPLECYDMVLGVNFLRTLGPILWDFDDLCMAFWHLGKRVLWKGIGSTSRHLRPLVLCMPLARMTILFWTTCFLPLRMSLRNQQVCHLLDLVTIESIYFREQHQQQLDHISILNFKRMSSKHSVPPCSSKA